MAPAVQFGHLTTRAETAGKEIKESETNDGVIQEKPEKQKIKVNTYLI